MEEGEILSSGQIFHSKTKHFVPVHHAWQEEGGCDQNGVKQRQRLFPPPVALLSRGLTLLLSVI